MGRFKTLFAAIAIVGTLGVSACSPEALVGSVTDVEIYRNDSTNQGSGGNDSTNQGSGGNDSTNQGSGGNDSTNQGSGGNDSTNQG